MIILKATQDKVLAVLQSVSGIVGRRHTLPALANVLIHESGCIITNGFPEAGGGGASAGVTDGPDVAASDDDDGGDGDGEDDCQRPRSKHKQPSPGPAPHKRGNARTGTRNAATKPPQPVDALLLRLPAVLSTFPVSRSAWFAGVKDGRYPKPVRLSARAVAWKASDIRTLVDSLASGQ